MAEHFESHGFLSKYFPLRSDASKAPLDEYDKFMARHFNHMKHRGNYPLNGVHEGFHTSPMLDAHSNSAVHDQDFMTFTSGEPFFTITNSDSPKIADKDEEKTVQKLLSNDNNITSGLVAVSVALLTLVAMLGFRIRKRRATRQSTASLGSGAQVIDMSMPISAASTDNLLELRAQELITESQEEVPQQSAQSALHQDNVRSRGWWSSSSQNSLPATVCFSTSPGREDTTGGMGVEAITKSADVVAFHLSTCPFCIQTFAALDAEGIEYKKVDMTPEIKEELKQMTGKGSAPSVWIKGTYVGGCNDGTESWHGVKPMLKSGKFQEMLSDTNAVFLSAPTALASSDNILDVLPTESVRAQLQAQGFIPDSQEEVPQQSAQSTPNEDSFSIPPGREDTTGGTGDADLDAQAVRKGLQGIDKAWELGERTRVKLVPGVPGVKLRKKQRRSRSPMLYQCETENGEECWLHLPVGQSHLSKRTDEILAYVTEVDVDEVEGDILVLSPTRSEQTDRAPISGPPNGGRLLDKLQKNDPIEGTVLRFLAKDIVLVACRGVYRKASSGYRRQAAVLRDPEPGTRVGDTVDCYVRLVERTSGRLTVSRTPVDTGSLRKERVAARLRKQIKRGTLAPGKQRIATVINYVGDFLVVDAGGVVAEVDAPDEEEFSTGDRIMVRIESVDAEALTATLSYVSVEELEDEELEDEELEEGEQA